MNLPNSYLDAYLQRSETKRRDVIAYLAMLDHLRERAPSVAEQIIQELRSQRTTLKLIASENYSSLSVQLAMGNLLTDKYCEGFPYHRFYAGCEHVDAIEAEAVSLAKQLFNTDHAYVQPHSGADANLVAFWAILTQRIQQPLLKEWKQKNLEALTPQQFESLRGQLCQQSFMGLGLSSGGHLSHGFRQNISAKMMRAVNYEVDPTSEKLDYSAIAVIARREKPLILLAGYSAYPRRINFAKMREIADSVGAVLMVDMAHFAGLVAGKVFQGDENPASFAHILTSTTHKTLRGPRGGIILCTSEFAESVNGGCPAVLGGPLPHIIAAKALAFREALDPTFQSYAERIVSNARALAEGLQKRGVPLVTGGTDNHLILMKLTPFAITGRIAENALNQAGIVANRNMIPFDPQGAWYTSGVRLGTAAVTTLGMGAEEMKEIAELVTLVIHHTRPKPATRVGEPASKSQAEIEGNILEQVRRRIEALLERFPLYPELQLI